MRVDVLTLTVCCCTVLVVSVRPVAGLSASVRLRRHLQREEVYDKRALPVINGTGAIRVGVGMNINMINSVDDRNQWLNWVGYVNVTWVNPYLTWRPEDWEGIRYLYITEDDMWVPDISILERIDDDIGFGEQKRRLIQVTYTGYVTWFLGGGTISTWCSLDATRFPFDHQQCLIRTGSYVMSNEDIKIVSGNDSRVDQLLGSNSLWEVTGFDAFVKSYIYTLEHGPVEYEYLYFTLQLQRKPLYFVMNIILPCMLMSALMCVVFLLPPDGGEKVGFSVTLLLAFNVIQLVIVDWMPQTSESLPIIAVYVSLLMLLAGLCLPLSVFVIYIHNNGYHHLPVCLQALLFSSHRRKHSPAARSHDYNTESVNHTKMETYIIWHEILEELKYKRLRIQRKDMVDNEKAQWAKAANGLDKLILRLYMGIILVIHVVCAILILSGHGHH